MTEFPQYRKYPNEKAFFKITSETVFEELTILGKNYGLMQVEAKNFLDRHLINDMIGLMGNNWIAIGADEYESKLKYCQENFNLMKSL